MDIHRCRFVPYNPQAINALAFSHPPSRDLAGRGVKTLRLAVGRANGDIEIWNPLRGAWFQETVLRGGKDRSIEGLAWTMDPAEDDPDGSGSKIPGRLRLFSIGYSNAVTEWDLEKGLPARHSGGNYGEIWCLAAQPRWKPAKGKDGKPLPPAEGEFTGQHLAAGCADGSIVILSTADGDLKFLRIMRPSTKRARVLSITFQNRNVIAAGYADSSIRMFDIRNGQLLRTISLGRGPSGGPKEILVWSVKCLPDETIVSGDSTGEIKFWDAKNYSLIQRVQGHQADVLDVAVSADGESVISGGADQRTVVYRLKPGEKGDKRRRWAEVMHRRYHTHDVKTFAVYETKDISVAVSGGPDAAPVVLPLREFGKEHHRKLSSLPQIPQLRSSPSSRLIMSFWDREVRLWRIPRGPRSLHDAWDGPRHQLVGRVLVQGEENITSATLSSDGSLLVVATISSVKVFTLRQRKEDERDILKVQKVDVPSEVSDDGARLVAVSPDLRWLSIVRPNSEIYLAKMSPSSSKEKPQIHPKLIKVERAPRHSRHEKASHGTLGNYERTIRSIVFSDDSQILASGDLSGCVDVWVLEDVSPSSSSSNEARKSNGVASSDDESSDDEDEQPIIDGQRWKPSPSESPIPRLPSGIVFLSFRPRRPANSKKALTNGTHGPAVDDRLMVLTSEHQMVEFEALKGSFSDWSRRNPKAYLPAEFTGVKDRAMGGIWDISDDNRERLWLYGTSWLWMFDLTHDFPSPEDAAAADQQSGQLVKASSSQKRKRELEDDDDREDERRKYNSGAGDKIPLAQVDVSLGTKMRKIVGNDESKEEWVQVEKQRQLQRKTNANDEEEEDEFEHGGNPFLGNNDQSNFARLRRDNPEETTTTTPEKTPEKKRLTNGISRADIFPDGDNGSSFAVVVDNTGSSNSNSNSSSTQNKKNAKKNEQKEAEEETEDTNHRPHRQWWHTYKYRDIFGIVPLGQSSDSNETESVKDLEERSPLEVAVVERPLWDMDLPGRYVRDYE